MREPRYNKPEKPGVWMSFDNHVDIYHIIGEDDGFEKAAQDVFDLLKESQERFPDWPRNIYIDIAGHVMEDGRFEEDFVEFQQEFMISFMGPFFTAIELPLLAVYNPEEQRNDVPDRLNIGPPKS